MGFFNILPCVSSLVVWFWALTLDDPDGACSEEQWLLPQDFDGACLRVHKNSSSLRSKALIGQNRFEVVLIKEIQKESVSISRIQFH